MRRAKYEDEALEPFFISMEDLQYLLNCGKTKAFALVSSGQIESVMDGRRRLPVYESAKSYAARLREMAKSQMQPEAA